ncbi:hypothetical protein TCAL_00900 [Tigriopus californicus]|uniref:Protein kinase domain-containing protein n=1 Tax=Tigriopus californicus TaxID=6832 RepID=A0A553P5Y7_TIGCA|nr:inner centromere protein A-like [Tigriopus californicus]TRY73098.1 hypothetical protein TCAL_00900 [Tigriopus californicus]
MAGMNTIYVDESAPQGDPESQFFHRKVIIKRSKDVRQKFDILNEIGRGKFGKVMKCRKKENGEQFAAKFVLCSTREERRNVEREVEIMNLLKSSKLLQLFDAYEMDRTEMCLVTEYIGGGELFDRVIEDEFVLTERACVCFMKQILEGVSYIHHQEIIHLDLKPENILCLTKTGNRIKIIDFGLARKFEPLKKLQVLFGTPEFVAPEVVGFEPISYATDMWAVGVICYVLLSGLSPFMGDTDLETMANVTIAEYDYEDEAFDEISEDARDFMNRLLVKEKEKRSTASNCLKHKWIQQLESPNLAVKSEALTSAKTNLATHKEHWREQDNHDYVFDEQNRTITAPTISPTKMLESPSFPNPPSSLDIQTDLSAANTALLSPNMARSPSPGIFTLEQVQRKAVEISERKNSARLDGTDSEYDTIGDGRKISVCSTPPPSVSVEREIVTQFDEQLPSDPIVLVEDISMYMTDPDHAQSTASSGFQDDMSCVSGGLEPPTTKADEIIHPFKHCDKAIICMDIDNQPLWQTAERTITPLFEMVVSNNPSSPLVMPGSVSKSNSETSVKNNYNNNQHNNNHNNNLPLSSKFSAIANKNHSFETPSLDVEEPANWAKEAPISEQDDEVKEKLEKEVEQKESGERQLQQQKTDQPPQEEDREIPQSILEKEVPKTTNGQVETHSDSSATVEKVEESNEDEKMESEGSMSSEKSGVNSEPPSKIAKAPPNLLQTEFRPINFKPCPPSRKSHPISITNAQTSPKPYRRTVPAIGPTAAAIQADEKQILTIGNNLFKDIENIVQSVKQEPTQSSVSKSQVNLFEKTPLSSEQARTENIKHTLDALLAEVDKQIRFSFNSDKANNKNRKEHQDRITDSITHVRDDLVDVKNDINRLKSDLSDTKLNLENDSKPLIDLMSTLENIVPLSSSTIANMTSPRVSQNNPTQDIHDIETAMSQLEKTILEFPNTSTYESNHQRNRRSSNKGIFSTAKTGSVNETKSKFERKPSEPPMTPNPGGRNRQRSTTPFNSARSPSPLQISSVRRRSPSPVKTGAVNRVKSKFEVPSSSYHPSSFARQLSEGHQTLPKTFKLGASSRVPAKDPVVVARHRHSESGASAFSSSKTRTRSPPKSLRHSSFTFSSPLSPSASSKSISSIPVPKFTRFENNTRPNQFRTTFNNTHSSKPTGGPRRQSGPGSPGVDKPTFSGEGLKDPGSYIPTRIPVTFTSNHIGSMKSKNGMSCGYSDL